MSKYIFFNEEWNGTECDICPIHYIEKDSDGFCPKCLEEKNNNYYVRANYRELQGVSNSRKSKVGGNRSTGKK